MLKTKKMIFQRCAKMLYIFHIGNEIIDMYKTCIPSSGNFTIPLEHLYLMRRYLVQDATMILVSWKLLLHVKGLIQCFNQCNLQQWSLGCFCKIRFQVVRQLRNWKKKHIYYSVNAMLLAELNFEDSLWSLT